ncbi:uncharacterized protein LOC134739764 [Pongo pygmaeus]|uniref:uncharacterized protein LOC134739764 n=1 Tax=Pongo pygmaeus TaxID=9600 RepID=UPI00300C2F3F
MEEKLHWLSSILLPGTGYCHLRSKDEATLWMGEWSSKSYRFEQKLHLSGVQVVTCDREERQDGDKDQDLTISRGNSLVFRPLTLVSPSFRECQQFQFQVYKAKIFRKLLVLSLTHDCYNKQNVTVSSRHSTKTCHLQRIHYAKAQHP